MARFKDPWKNSKKYKAGAKLMGKFFDFGLTVAKTTVSSNSNTRKRSKFKAHNHELVDPKIHDETPERWKSKFLEAMNAGDTGKAIELLNKRYPEGYNNEKDVNKVHAILLEEQNKEKKQNGVALLVVLAALLILLYFVLS